MEGVYGGTWYMEEGGWFGKCERSCNWVQEEDECRSKMIGEIGYGKRKRF